MTEMLKDAYHVRNGLSRMYAVDASMAVAQHPEEWSLTPWTKEDAETASKALADRHAKEVADAKARGAPEPAPLPPAPPPPTPEEQKAIDEHTKAVAEAKTRLDKFYTEEKKKKEISDQVAADERLIHSPPPQPDPNVRRPMTPAQHRKYQANKPDDDKPPADDNDQRTPEQKAAEAQDAATKRERDRIAAGQSSPNPISPVDHQQGKTAQQIANEKAETDRIAGAKVHNP